MLEKTIVFKHSIYDSTDKALMVEGYEKRVCIDISDPRDFKARDIPQDIYDVLKKTKGGT